MQFFLIYDLIVGKDIPFCVPYRYFSSYASEASKLDSTFKPLKLSGKLSVRLFLFVEHLLKSLQSMIQML